MADPSGQSSFLALKGRGDLAEWLGITDKRLRYLLYATPEENRYSVFQVPKRSGGVREIAAPAKFLSGLQRKISDAIAEVAPPRHMAKGYVRGSSILDHAAPHAGRRWIICADLDQFFPSLHFGRVKGMFRAAPFHFPDELAMVLSQLCCFRGALPQGSPSSPAISNVLCRALDRRLLDLAKACRSYVTRYADDVCLSTNLHVIPPQLARHVGTTLVPGIGLVDAVHGSGFALNMQKFRVSRARTGRTMVTGLVLSEVPRLPRRWRRETRTMLHLLEKYGEEHATAIVHEHRRKRAGRKPVDITRILSGRVSFAASVDAKVGTRFIESLERAFPSHSRLFSRRREKFAMVVVTEGKTDYMFLKGAYERLKSSGHEAVADVDLSFSDWPVRQAGGDEALKRHLEEISAHDLPERTLGLFDCDNPRIASWLNPFEKGVRRVGPAVLAACLPRPDITDSAYCIEHFIPPKCRNRATADGRRLFDASEFDAMTGVHISKTGLFKANPQKRTLIVDEGVVDATTGERRSLSKAEFCRMVCSGVAPFEDFDWSCFDPVIEFLAEVARSGSPAS